MRQVDSNPRRGAAPTIPHDVKLAKQVRQLHKAVVKPQPPQWPAPTHSVMLPDAE